MQSLALNTARQVEALMLVCISIIMRYYKESY